MRLGSLVRLGSQLARQAACLGIACKAGSLSGIGHELASSNQERIEMLVSYRPLAAVRGAGALEAARPGARSTASYVTGLEEVRSYSRGRRRRRRAREVN